MINALIFVLCSCTVNNSLNASKTQLRSGDEILLSDFETDDELLSMNYFNYFGKESISHDLKYITKGKGCGKFIIYGEPNVTDYNLSISSPFLYIYTDNKYVSKNDYSDVNEFRLDIFNNSDKDTKMDFIIESKSEKGDGEITYISTVSLLKGISNKVSIPFLREKFMKSKNIKNITKFCLVFESRKSLSDKPLEIYIDNFRAVKTNSPIALLNTKLQPDELSFFENDGDVWSMEAGGYDTEFLAAPILSLNRDLNFISQGRGSLKALINKSNIKRYRFTSGWLKIGLTSKLIKSIDFTKFDINKTDIAFDIYNKSDKYITIEFQAWSENMKPYKQGIIIPPNSWANRENTKVSLKTLKDMFITLDKLNGINFLIEEFYNGDPKELYLDNIRIVRN
jgi:hypothetical protein